MNNFVILLGHIGADPELKTFANGTQCATFTLATTQSYKSKTGEKKTTTQWHNIIFWGAKAKVICDYFKKGSKIQITGMITYDSYKKDGETKYITRINASDFEFIEKSSNQNASQQTQPVNQDNQEETDDLPF